MIVTPIKQASSLVVGWATSISGTKAIDFEQRVQVDCCFSGSCLEHIFADVLIVLFRGKNQSTAQQIAQSCIMASTGGLALAAHVVFNSPQVQRNHDSWLLFLQVPDHSDCPVNSNERQAMGPDSASDGE